MNPIQVKDLYKNLTDLGSIFSTESVTSPLVSILRDRESVIRDKCDVAGAVGRVATFVQISKEPLFTVGGSSLITEIVEGSGGHLLTRGITEAYPKISKETALSLKPDAIILSDSDDNKEPNEVFKNSDAVKNGRVLKVNADILSRPGPRLIDAMEQIAKFLHPEKFK